MQDDYGNQLPHQAVARQLAEGGERMTRMEQDIADAREQLREIHAQMGDLLEFLHAMRGAFKVLDWLGKVAKPMAYIVMLASAALAFWKTLGAGGGR